jgi:hypothetical protein
MPQPFWLIEAARERGGSISLMPKGLGGAVAKAVRFAPEFNDRENPMSSGTDGRPYGRAGGHLPDVGTQEARQSAREVGG